MRRFLLGFSSGRLLVIIARYLTIFLIMPTNVTVRPKLEDSTNTAFMVRIRKISSALYSPGLLCSALLDRLLQFLMLQKELQE